MAVIYFIMNIIIGFGQLFTPPNPREMRMKIGIIDIGSNSVRLVIVDVEDDSYSIIDQIKHSARLGQDMTPDGYLSEARIDYGIKVLEHFAGFMKKHQVEEAIVVATEAVRKEIGRAHV